MPLVLQPTENVGVYPFKCPRCGAYSFLSMLSVNGTKEAHCLGCDHVASIQVFYIEGVDYD